MKFKQKFSLLNYFKQKGAAIIPDNVCKIKS